MVVTVTGLSKRGEDIVNHYPHWKTLLYPFRAVVVDNGTCIHVTNYGSIGIIYFTISK